MKVKMDSSDPDIRGSLPALRRAARAAGKLAVRTGTIKSRLFRLYQRLGVKMRPAAVLRAAELLAT